MNSLFQLLTLQSLFCSCLPLRLQLGSWPSLSELYSSWSLEHAGQMSLRLDNMFKAKMQVCKPIQPKWIKHPMGILGHMKLSNTLSRIAERVTNYDIYPDESWKQFTKGITLSNFAEHEFVRYIHHMALIETHACEYLARNIDLIAQLAATVNVSLIDNETILVLGTETLDLRTYHGWEAYYQASLFSSVGAAVALWIILLRRTPIGRAFTSLLMFLVPSTFPSTLRSLSQTLSTSTTAQMGSPSLSMPIKTESSTSMTHSRPTSQKASHFSRRMMKKD
ncbi:GP2 [Lopma virus]|nr:GP2 [Lopma virus]